MEKSGGLETVNDLRKLQSLLTTPVRDEMAAFLTAGCTSSEYNKKLDALVLEMWVEMHWSTDNPLIHKDLGVPLQIEFYKYN